MAKWIVSCRLARCTTLFNSVVARSDTIKMGLVLSQSERRAMLGPLSRSWLFFYYFHSTLITYKISSSNLYFSCNIRYTLAVGTSPRAPRAPAVSCRRYLHAHRRRCAHVCAIDSLYGRRKGEQGLVVCWSGACSRRLRRRCRSVLCSRRRSLFVVCLRIWTMQVIDSLGSSRNW